MRHGRRRIARPAAAALITVAVATSAVATGPTAAGLTVSRGAARVDPVAAQPLPKGAYWYSLLALPTSWRITEGAGVTVAVLDTGVDAQVGDLRGQVLPGLDLTGKDRGAQRDDPVGADRFGHGTDMAALIAGTGKGAGLKGVAPQAKILPIDAGSDAGINGVARGVTWAVEHGAKVINLSVGSVESCDPAEARALRYAYDNDVIVVAAAGEPAGAVQSPANCPGALAISAVGAAIKPWLRSASGPEVDFAAPGYALVNELLTDRLNPANPSNSGTSQACAIAAGTFALLRARFPHDTARQIVTRALYTLHNGVGKSAFGTRINNSIGYGMVLPRYALTVAPPAGATNPIYDQWARDFATASSTPSTPARTSALPSSGTSASPGALTNAGPVASRATSSVGSDVLIVVVVVVGLAVSALVVVFVRRRSGRRLT